MKIAIPPYPFLQFVEGVIERDVEPNTVVLKNSTVLSNNLFFIFKDENDVTRLVKQRPVKYQDKLYLSVFPNPVHLLLSTSIEHYNLSEKIKETNFIKCGNYVADDVLILPMDESHTHECYNNYLKYRISSIIMLVTSLEAFLNHIIPNDFIYTGIRKSVPFNYTKNEIESTKISFKEKFEDVIPQWLNDKCFWSKRKFSKDIINTLYLHRRNIIHLKTNSEDDFDRYFKVFDEMLNFDIQSGINTVIEYMNSVSQGFVKFETENKNL